MNTYANQSEKNMIGQRQMPIAGKQKNVFNRAIKMTSTPLLQNVCMFGPEIILLFGHKTNIYIYINYMCIKLMYMTRIVMKMKILNLI